MPDDGAGHHGRPARHRLGSMIQNGWYAEAGPIGAVERGVRPSRATMSSSVQES
jgi:hypothetical protein